MLQNCWRFCHFIMGPA